MSLSGSLQIGRTGLNVAQAAMQVAGKNMTNAATEGYHRRDIHLAPLQGRLVGDNQWVGRGVDLVAVRREIDAALESRLRQAVADEQASVIDQRYLTAIETIQNELTENDLSSLLSEFFNAFSELANNPEDNTFRTLTVEQGRSVATRITQMRGDYGRIRQELDDALGNTLAQANTLLDRVAELNARIGEIEGVNEEAASLRDQRDAALDELATLIDITTAEQNSGAVDVFVNSVPVVLNDTNRGLRVDIVNDGTTTRTEFRIDEDGTFLTADGGRIGGLLRQREETVQPAIDALDTLAEQLIFQVNRVHSQGQGRTPLAEVTSSNVVQDTTAALNSTDADLPFDMVNGSFHLHVTNTTTGERSTWQIDVDPGTMSLDDLVNEINVALAVPNATAATTPANRLQIAADGGHAVSFSEDSSGVLAALGINTFFSGSNAADIDVDAAVIADPGRVAARLDHVPGSNDNAIALANLQDTTFTELGDRNLREYWRHTVSEHALRTDGAARATEAATVVRESLAAEVQSVSGVSLDEESINLIQFQRQYQAAARYITVIDEMMQTLLSIA